MSGAPLARLQCLLLSRAPTSPAWCQQPNTGVKRLREAVSFLSYHHTCEIGDNSSPCCKTVAKEAGTLMVLKNNLDLTNHSANPRSYFGTDAPIFRLPFHSSTSLGVNSFALTYSIAGYHFGRISELQGGKGIRRPSSRSHYIAAL